MYLQPWFLNKINVLKKNIRIDRRNKNAKACYAFSISDGSGVAAGVEFNNGSGVGAGVVLFHDGSGVEICSWFGSGVEIRSWFPPDLGFLKYLPRNSSATSENLLLTKLSRHFRYEKSSLRPSVETTKKHLLSWKVLCLLTCNKVIEYDIK